MAYQDTGTSIVIDGWENGIASSPYVGIANIRNLNTSYYPSVAYVNYRRQGTTMSNSGWYAGTHSVNVSDNLGWVFTAPTSSGMGNPLYKAQSGAGLNYILDSTGAVFKQSAVNSSTFNYLGNGSGRKTNGAGGLAYWNNYLVVFGNGTIEFCGDGTGDAGITSANWNLNNTTSNFTAQSSPSQLTVFDTTNLYVNGPIQVSTNGSLPVSSPQIVAGTTYYVTSITGEIVQISTVAGGGAITYSTAGTGTHKIFSVSPILPIYNMPVFAIQTTPQPGDTTGNILTYTDPTGTTYGPEWQQPTGQYNILTASGDNILATLTYGSKVISFLSPISRGELGTASEQILNATTSLSLYKPYVSKVDGNLYFANGRNLGRILSENTNTVFNPSATVTYVVDYAATEILQQSDTITDMTDLQSTLIISGQKDLYTWDYISANVTAPSPVGEVISTIRNLLNNIFVFSGQKGSVYIYNGFSAQLFTKLPDFIAGVIDPVWSWGDTMVKRSKLFFQALAQDTSGNNILAGVFSLIASKPQLNEQASGLVMEAQNSYGLTPASGSVSNGVLIDNSSSSNGQDSYYSAWSNGASTGGIDYNDTSLWQNFEPTIETDIIPIGKILDKKTFGNIEFKLDRPMASGDQIKLFWRPSLSDAYVQIGPTFTNTQLSDYAPANISQAQWAQFKITYKAASSGSSFIPLRELTLYYD